jgi:hypothetical protein
MRVPPHLLREGQVAQHAAEHVRQRVERAAAALPFQKGQVLAARRLGPSQIGDAHPLLAREPHGGRRRLAVRIERGGDRRARDHFLQVLLALGNPRHPRRETAGRRVGLHRGARGETQLAQARLHPVGQLLGQSGQPRRRQLFDTNLDQQLSVHQCPLSTGRLRLSHPGLRDRDRQLPHAQDIRHPLGDADAAARIEQVEHVRALEAVVERGQHQAGTQQRTSEAVILVEQVPMERMELRGGHVDLSEGVLRLLDLVAVAHVTIRHAGPPLEVEHVIHVLERHREALEAVGELDGDGREVHAARLLEVGELRNLLAVEEHLPADAPCTERGRFPVVLLEAHVVGAQIDAAGLEALQVELLHLVGCRLEDDLELMVLEQPVRILAEAPVGRPP